MMPGSILEKSFEGFVSLINHVFFIESYADGGRPACQHRADGGGEEENEATTAAATTTTTATTTAASEHTRANPRSLRHSISIKQWTRTRKYS
jgi:hypothetical protein